MKLEIERRGAARSVPRFRRWHAAAGAVLAALLAGCGGGDQVSPFTPTRLIAIGDESSVIDASGRKYTVNALTPAGAPDCQANPIWVQQVATSYGFVFAECNPDAVAVPAAVMQAAPGATVATATQQIDQATALGLDGAMVTVLVGMHDVLALYGQFPAVAEADLIAQAGAAGSALGQQVNRITQAGGKVLVATVPDLGLTPFARAEKAAHTDTDRAALMTRLTKGLNDALRTALDNDGRKIGLVQAEDLVHVIVRDPSVYSFANGIDPVCTVALPDCTTATLVANTNGNAWLWADNLHLSAGGQFRLGEIARARAHNNPF